MSEPEILQVGEYGPSFILRDGRTVDGVRDSVAASQAKPKPLLCRLRHRFKTVGDTNLGERALERGDLTQATLDLIATSDYARLVQCSRCGVLRALRRF